jgi:hypothetical protein
MRVTILFGAVFVAALSLLLRPEPDKPSPARAATDAAIMDTVMVDLLTAKDSPWEGTKGPVRPEDDKREILLSIDPLAYRPEEDTILLRYEKKQWDILSKGELGSTKEAAKDLIGRSAEKDWLASYKPADRRIVLVSDEEQEGIRKVPKRSFDGPQVFRSFPPGYSRDGKIACVHLTYPWSGGFHGGVATYVLENRKGKWIILLRQFIRYV